MNNRLSVFISTPYSYNDVMSIFYKCFKVHWKDCPYDLFIATNKFVESFSENIIYCSEDLKDDWVTRSLPALKKICSKYVLMMCDDLMIIKQPDFVQIEKILDVMDKFDINYCNLKKKRKGKRIVKGIMYLPKKMPYSRTLQIGIFKKEYLLNVLKKANCDAWGIENMWNKEAASSKKGFFDDVIGVNYPPISFIHGIEKGKWIPSAKTKLTKLGYVIDNNRQTMKKKDELALFLKEKASSLIPFRLRAALKRVLKKLGFKFAIDN